MRDDESQGRQHVVEARPGFRVHRRLGLQLMEGIAGFIVHLDSNLQHSERAWSWQKKKTAIGEKECGGRHI